MKQSLLTLVAIALGVAIPAGRHLVDWVQYLLMAMLYFSFIDVDLHRQTFARSHLYVVAANLVTACLFYVVCLPLGQTMALTAFVICIGPTAVAAPVIAQLLRADVPYVTVSVLLTNPAVALAIPFILPLLIRQDTPVALMDVLTPVLAVVFVPLLAAFATKKVGGQLLESAQKLRFLAFILFLINIWIGCGSATHFIRFESHLSTMALWHIFILTTVLCILLFQLGERLAPMDLALSAGLSLGRKNTMFSFWLAITFLEPVIAIGPILYILVQNLYNTYQMVAIAKSRTIGKTKHDSH